MGDSIGNSWVVRGSMTLSRKLEKFRMMAEILRVKDDAV